MIAKLLTFFIGEKKTRNFKKLKPIIDEINRWDEEFGGLSDEQLQAKTEEFRRRLAEGETEDDLLAEAFAVVKQACRRMCGQSWEAGGNSVTWDMAPFDVQLAGGIELHRGNIAEMATGEGKTLVATLPLYLNALSGQGAHLVTVNDYLARRDAEWMGKIYEFLGLTVGVILSDMTPEQRRQSYGCDITYGTNNEFGFDYLRDNMAISPDHLVQREHHYAIVDEVDSVLIDEARTPLIISGQVDRSIPPQYTELKPLVSELVKRQTRLVNDLVAEAEKLLAEAEKNGKDQGDLTYEAGIKLQQARMGHPKHKRLAKVLGDAPMQRLVTRVENDFMRDKRMTELEEPLYFVVDEKGHNIDLTQRGREALSPQDPDLFLVPDIVEAMAEIESRDDLEGAERERLKEQVMAEIEQKTETIHIMSQLLRAYTMYEKDVEYVVQDNKVIIVDEFTGRLMPGRRWSDGLHQAIEAKEGATVEKETQTLATITLQNYFRMYDKLAGMTGTAETEAAEFGHTYKMDVAVIPTHRPIHRLDDNDLIYKTQREKFNALIEAVQETHAAGLPMLIGTTSVDTSEKISRMLRRMRISHNVLNAKNHAQEAHIVRDAGKTGAVTIATNMAGRGTDIKLGPGVIRCKGEGFEGPCCGICPFKDEIEEKTGRTYEIDEEMPACGLHIFGTTRHEARRIDRQLRGRAGRQGDPGYSQFYLSLEDDLIRMFAPDWISKLMAKGFEEGEAMNYRMSSRAIESAQKKVEERNFEFRKKTLEYDNVMNKQREAIYGFRRRVLCGTEDARETVMEVARAAVDNEFAEYGANPTDMEHFDAQGFLHWLRSAVPMIDLKDVDPEESHKDAEAWLNKIDECLERAYTEKTEVLGQEMNDRLSRFVILRIIDSHWRDHLLAIDELREGVGWRGVGQLDPLTEYQRDATYMFEEMMTKIYKAAFEHVFRATIVREQRPDSQATMVAFQKAAAASAAEQATRQAAAQSGGDGGQRTAAHQPFKRNQPKVGRNDPCPCGSGKKFKKCCGAPGAAKGEKLKVER